MQQHKNDTKQSIMKLLSFDSMITEYLRDSNPFRRKKYSKPKPKNNSALLNIPSDPMKTIQPSQSTKCTKSVVNVRKTIDENQLVRNKSNANSVRIFKTQHTIRNQDNSQSRFSNRRVRDGKTIEHKQMQMNMEEIKLKRNHWNTMSHFYKKPKTKLVSIFDWKEKKLKDRYVLGKIIGKGLSGVVYKGRDILADRDIAIKIIKENDPEYEIIKKLNHENIISYKNSFLQDGKRVLILQYLPKNLNEIASKQKPNDSTIKSIFKAIGSAVMYLHSQSFVHRDIKLNNILSNEDLTQIKLIDFGLCIDTSESKPEEIKQFCGTSAYICPQMIQRKCDDLKKADIWSLGIALYALAVGKPPFKGKKDIQIYHKITNNKAIFPNWMGEQLKSLISKMLQKNPSERPNIMQVLTHEWLMN